MNPADQIKLATLIPAISIVIVAIIGGGLGFIMIGIHKMGGGEWGAIIIGLALVVAVPVIAFLMQLRIEQDEKG